MSKINLVNERRKTFQLLKQTGLTIATAESCTGGLLAKYLTDLSGSSKFFQGGIVSYSNAAKREVLGVDISETESAVKKKIALAMAHNTCKLFSSDFSVATTGYMSPTDELKNQLRRRGATGYFFTAVCWTVNCQKSKQSKSRDNTLREKKMRKNHLEIKSACAAFYLYDTRHKNRVSASLLALRMLNHILSQSIRRT